MTDANTICHDVDLLGDWLDSRGYTEEAGLCLRVLGLIHEQAEEIEKLREQMSIDNELIQKYLIELQYAEERKDELFEDSIDASCKIAELQEENEKTKRFYIEAGFELRQLREDNKRLRAALKLCVCRPNEIAAALKGDGDEN